MRHHQLVLVLVLVLLVSESYATIEYKADELAGRWSKLGKLLCAFKGTVFPSILKGPMFWAIMFFHVFFIILDRILIWSGDFTPATSIILSEYDVFPLSEDYEQSFADLMKLFGYDFANCQSELFGKLPLPVATFGIGLVFFFVVFYNGNCYSRYYTLYGHTVGMGGQIMEWTAIAKSNFPDDPTAQWNSVRFILASQQMLYYMLADDDGQLDPPFWELLQKRKLLTPAESDVLADYKGFKPFLAVYWALTESKYQLGLGPKVEAAEPPPSPPYSPLTLHKEEQEDEDEEEEIGSEAPTEAPTSSSRLHLGCGSCLPSPPTSPPEGGMPDAVPLPDPTELVPHAMQDGFSANGGAPLATLEKKVGADGRVRLKKKYHAGSLEAIMQALERVAAKDKGAGGDGGQKTSNAGAEFAAALRGELVLTQLRDKAFSFRGHCGQIVNTLKQPVPYPYFHLLNLILFINLVLFGFAVVILAWWPFTLLVVGIVSVILLGMRVLAVQLSDPFGEDAVDFEIEQFLKGAYVNSIAHLQQPKHAGCGFKQPKGIGCPVIVPDESGVEYTHPRHGLMKVKSPEKTWRMKPPELGPSQFGFKKT